MYEPEKKVYMNTVTIKSQRNINFVKGLTDQTMEVIVDRDNNLIAIVPQNQSEFVWEKLVGYER